MIPNACHFPHEDETYRLDIYRAHKRSQMMEQYCRNRTDKRMSSTYIMRIIYVPSVEIFVGEQAHALSAFMYAFIPFDPA